MNANEEEVPHIVINEHLQQETEPVPPTPEPVAVPEPEPQGSTEDARAKRRAWANARNAHRIANHLCLGCGSAAEAGRTRCRKCLDKCRHTSLDRYHRTHPGARSYKKDMRQD